MTCHDSLAPIRLDLEVDDIELRDYFTWNTEEPDSEISTFAKRTVKDLRLPAALIQPIGQSILSQVEDFRALRRQKDQSEAGAAPTSLASREEKLYTLKIDVRVNNTSIRDKFVWDVNNPHANPEEFAYGLCSDLNVDDPQVAPAVAVAIREQLLEVARQNAGGRESRKKTRRDRMGPELFGGRPGFTILSLAKKARNAQSMIRRKSDGGLFEPILEVLSDRQKEVLEIQDMHRRLKRKAEEEDLIQGRFFRG